MEGRRTVEALVATLNAGNVARKSTRELDILLVGGVLGPAAASLYHIAKKLGEVLVLAGTPIQQAVYPELARLWVRAEIDAFMARPPVGEAPKLVELDADELKALQALGYL